jgi:alpha-glucosidase (family GH31 glycosyl hydrolase)
MNMLPYIYEQAKLSCETGLPLMRAMAIEYPQNTACIQMTWQYFFGEKLLVAPVTEEGCSVLDVYLPEGRWLDFFEDNEYAHEGLVSIPAGIETIPVLIRQDSIISLNLDDSLKLCSHVGNNIDAYDNLCFMLYLKDCATSHFDDDTGNNFDIVARNTQEGIHIAVSGNIMQPITLIIRHTDFRRVFQNGNALAQCGVEALCEGKFASRKNSLFIRIDDETDISIA